MDSSIKDFNQLKSKMKASKCYNLSKKRTSVPLNTKFINSQENLGSANIISSRRTRRKLNNLGDAIHKLKTLFDNTKNKFVIMDDKSFSDINICNKNKENIELLYSASINRPNASYRKIS